MDQVHRSKRQQQRLPLRFTIRGMLLAITIVAVAVWAGDRWSKAQRQKRAVAMLTKETMYGGEPFNAITYDFERDGRDSPRHAPRWLVNLFGVDCFADVVGFRRGVRPEAPDEYGREGLGVFSSFPKVEELSLFMCRVTDADLELLKDHRNLHSLEIPYSPVTGVGLEHLPFRQRLRRLSLLGCPVADEGLAVIGELENLEELNLNNGGYQSRSFSTKGLAHLAGLRRLKKLHLAGYILTEDDFAEIAKIRSLALLRFEPWHATGEAIMQLQTLPELRYLHVTNDWRPTYIPKGKLETALRALAESRETGNWTLFDRAAEAWEEHAVESGTEASRGDSAAGISEIGHSRSE